MARADLFGLDEGATGAPRVGGPRTDTSQVTEEDIYKATRQAGIDLGVDAETLAYEAGLAGDTSTPLNKMTPEERSAFSRGRADKITQSRQTGGGTEPPYEAPTGTHWSFMNGAWKLYKDFETGDAGSSNSGVPGLTAVGSKIFQFLNGKMYYDGALFTGEQDGAKWVDGVKTAIASGKDEDGNPIWKPVTGLGNSSTSSTTSTAVTGYGPGSAGYADRKSAYDLLFEKFNQYGLGSLVEPLKGLVMENISPSEFSIRLQDTDAYKKRFSANADRIAKGLQALTPAEYIGLEDQYQNVMRNYGLPESYWTKDSMGKQEGFDKFLANDVSAVELENRLIAAQDRVLKSNPEVIKALKQFYPDITNGDILAYSLDPKNALKDINRKVTAAEIGGAALAQGLTTDLSTAEQLAGYGVSKAQAQQGFQTVAEVAPRGSQLADFYNEPAYDQAAATAEVFGTAGAVEAAKKRKKLTALEQASFGGSAGTSQGALARDRQGAF